MSTEAGTVKVRLVKSPNSTPARHRLCVKALGLKRINHVVELKDSPSVRGLIYNCLLYTSPSPRD